MPAFLQDFEITNNIEDYVLSSDIQIWLEMGKMGITMKKFGMELKLHLKNFNYDNVTNVNKKLNGYQKQVWIGMKRN